MRETRRAIKPLAGVLAAVVIGVIVWLVACQGSTGTAQTPVAPADVDLSPKDEQTWAALPPDRSAIPTLLYQGIGPESDFEDASDASLGIGSEDFAEQMTLMKHAGYQTIGLRTLVDFVQRKHVDLPSRPLLLTFGDGRVDTWTGGDGILKKLGFTAVLFVDVGTVDRGDDPEYLSWRQLRTMQKSGRWDLQLHAGKKGNSMIPSASDPDEEKPYYATLAEGESLDDWRQRVR